MAMEPGWRHQNMEFIHGLHETKAYLTTVTTEASHLLKHISY